MAALAVGALGAVTAAQARSDVQFSIGLQVPGVYAQPAPFYVEPQPVYVQPQPVYVQPRPVYSAPQVYVNPAWAGYGRSYENERGWRQSEWRRRQWERRQEWERHHEWEEHRSRDRHWD
ncbi:MAG TPA: hypothetical protein VKP68_18195 [Ramlibacter sp.]|nr:hypothetical protein [Ramlibacter sp.]